MSPRIGQVQAKKLVAALKRAGFREAKQKGSHLTLVHDQKNLQTTIPMHAGDLGRGLLKAILNQAGITEDELRELL